MSRDSFGCHNWGRVSGGIQCTKAWDVAYCPTMHRRAPTKKELLGPEYQQGQTSEGKEPCSRLGAPQAQGPSPLTLQGPPYFTKEVGQCLVPLGGCVPSDKAGGMQSSEQAYLLKYLPHLLVESHRDPVDGSVQPSPAEPLALALPPANVVPA